MAIDFVYRQICDPLFTECHGFKVRDGYQHISMLGFADDQAIIARSSEAARNIVELAEQLFEQIGLKVNPRKSHAIRIEGGTLVPGELRINETSAIR